LALLPLVLAVKARVALLAFPLLRPLGPLVRIFADLLDLPLREARAVAAVPSTLFRVASFVARAVVDPVGWASRGTLAVRAIVAALGVVASIVARAVVDPVGRASRGTLLAVRAIVAALGVVASFVARAVVDPVRRASRGTLGVINKRWRRRCYDGHWLAPATRRHAVIGRLAVTVVPIAVSHVASAITLAVANKVDGTIWSAADRRCRLRIIVVNGGS